MTPAAVPTCNYSAPQVSRRGGPGPPGRKSPRGTGTTAAGRRVAYDAEVETLDGRWDGSRRSGDGSAEHPYGGVPVSTGWQTFGLRVVVGRLATLKVDRASIAEAQFSLAA